MLFQPVDYLANTESWMFSAISEVWLCELDCDMKILKREVILFINNCNSHEVVIQVEAVRLLYLPPNTK